MSAKDESYKALATFFVSLMVDLVDISSESFCGKILPLVVKLMQDQNNVEIDLACLMIVSRIVDRFQLSERLLGELLGLIFNLNAVSDSALMVVAKICESQEGLSQISLPSTLVSSEFVSICADLVARYELPRFTHMLLSELVRIDSGLCAQLMRDGDLPLSHVKQFTFSFLSSDDVQDAGTISEVLRFLENALNDGFYAALNECMPDENKRSACIAILQEMSGMSDINGLFVRAQHPDSQIRLDGIGEMLNNFDNYPINDILPVLELACKDDDERVLSLLVQWPKLPDVLSKPLLFEICLVKRHKLGSSLRARMLKLALGELDSDETRMMFVSRVFSLFMESDLNADVVIQLIALLADVPLNGCLEALAGLKQIALKELVGLGKADLCRYVIKCVSDELSDTAIGYLTARSFVESCTLDEFVFLTFVIVSRMSRSVSPRIQEYLVELIENTSFQPSAATCKDILGPCLGLPSDTLLALPSQHSDNYVVSNLVVYVFASLCCTDCASGDFEFQRRVLYFGLKHLCIPQMKDSIGELCGDRAEVAVKSLFDIWYDAKNDLELRILACRMQMRILKTNSKFVTNSLAFSLLGLSSESVALRRICMDFLKFVPKEVCGRSVIGIMVSEMLRVEEAVIVDSRRFIAVLADSLTKQDKATATNLLQTLVAESKNECNSPLFRKAMLSLLGRVNHPVKVKGLWPIFVQEFSRFKKNTSPGGMDRVCSLMSSLSGNYFSRLVQGNGDAQKFLSSVCKFATKSTPQFQDAFLTLVSEKTLFAVLATVHQQTFVHTFFTFISEGGADVSSKASAVIHALDVPSEILRAELHVMMSSAKSVFLCEEKSKRQKVATECKVFPPLLISLLELIHLRSKKTVGSELIAPLFETLGILLEIKTVEPKSSDVDYAVQLCVSSISSLIKKIPTPSDFGDSNIRVDLVVQCIRVTDNPQTHHEALLLLGTICQVWPKKVLCNVMPVFTFMGANVVRQDDSYSFYVIEQTIQTLLPPLVQFNANAESRLERIKPMKPVLQVFAQAFYHIPRHRRVRLFRLLIETLGEDDFFDFVLLMLIRCHGIRKSKVVTDQDENITEFCTVLVKHIRNHKSLNVVARLLEDLRSASDSEMASLLEIKNTSQGMALSGATLEWIVAFTKSGIFGERLKDAETEDIAASISQDIIEAAILLLDKLDDTESDTKLEKLTHQAIQSVNEWTSVPRFVRNLSGLISAEKHSAEMRNKALLLFNKRWTKLDRGVQNHYSLEWLSLVPAFTNIIADNEETQSNKQNAFLAIGLLSSLDAASQSPEFGEVMDEITGPNGIESSCEELSVSSTACLTAIISGLGPKSIVHLPKFGPALCRLLAKSVSQNHDLHMAAALKCAQMMLTILPRFTAPYIESILLAAINRSVVNSKFEMTQEPCQQIQLSFGRQVPLRFVMPAIFNIQERVMSTDDLNTGAYFRILREIIRQMKGESITAYHKQLFKLFLGAFDDVNCLSQVHSAEDSEAAEVSMFEAFTNLVMKMNESMFKPLFLKLVDWGTSDSSRSLVMYKVCRQLLESLKSLFAPYIGYLLDNLVQFLAAPSLDQEDIWLVVMDILRQTFLYEGDNHISEDQYRSLCRPLVNQLEVMAHHKDYAELVQSKLIPCLGQLALACSSHQSVLKELNHEVLMETRSSIASVRLMALTVLSEFYSKMGDEFLEFLPETIPFLAELMEDDDDDVEAICRRVINIIEGCLGESLQEHLK